MSKIFILVEGPTEKFFIEQILMPWFDSYQIFMIPTILTTKRAADGTPYKGGNDYSKIKKDLNSLLKDPSSIAVTTMFDLFGLPNNFPGKTDCPHSNHYNHIMCLEEAFSYDISNPKFIPYLQLHEFEAFLFADIATFADSFSKIRHLHSKLQAIRVQFQSPEEINDVNPPSRRIEELIPNYQKAVDGLNVIKKIGLDELRHQCLHFSEWCDKLQSIS
ncbi:MAG TPA: DUF4276 family protein [Candidatus Lokiarchaeia archaeon]|nr:DUF4276 family protein [Candidatus Lokiarchaeia archaeon]